MSGIVQLLRDHVLGLIPEVGLGPRTGQHDRRADTAEFGADRLADDPVVGRLAPLAFLSRAVHDQVVRARAAGDVDGLHRIMTGQVLADITAAVDEGQVPVAHQRGEDVLEDRPEVLVDRVHLADHDLTAVDHAVEDVQRHDRRDVPGSQHQGQFTIGIVAPVEAGHVLAQVLLGHAVAASTRPR